MKLSCIDALNSGLCSGMCCKCSDWSIEIKALVTQDN